MCRIRASCDGDLLAAVDRLGLDHDLEEILCAGQHFADFAVGCAGLADLIGGDANGPDAQLICCVQGAELVIGLGDYDHALHLEDALGTVY